MQEEEDMSAHKICLKSGFNDMMATDEISCKYSDTLRSVVNMVIQVLMLVNWLLLSG